MNSCYAIQPSQISGSIQVPSSKSQTLRAILFGSLAIGETIIRNPLSSPDVEAMIKGCSQLGAKVTSKEDEIHIEGNSATISPASDDIDAGNSGIVLRFLTATAALGTQPIQITGDDSIQSQRPMQELLEALEMLGAIAQSVKGNGYAPLIIEGPMTQHKAVLDGRDSQPVSALLIAGALSQHGLRLEVTNPGEIPWIDLTLDWLRRLGVSINHQSHHIFEVSGKHLWNGFKYSVPGDWSSAAFPIAAAVIGQSKLSIKNLKWEEPQGDKKIITILQSMGANIAINHDTVTVLPSGKLKGIEVNINDCIDTVTILSVLACYAEGKTVIKGAEVARTKECNRLESIAKELTKMGAKIEVTDDGLIIEGRHLHGATVSSHGDHRIAMSLALAAMGASGDTIVENTGCVSKTYPNFAGQFKKLGLKIEELS